MVRAPHFGGGGGCVSFCVSSTTACRLKFKKDTELFDIIEMAKPLSFKGVKAETLVPSGPERFTLDLNGIQVQGFESPQLHQYFQHFTAIGVFLKFEAGRFLVRFYMHISMISSEV